MKLALSMCVSGRFHYVSATCCRLRKAFTAPDEDEWWKLDLDNYFLPTTRLKQKSKLSEEPELAIATVLALDAYLSTADDSKGTHRTIATMACTIAKIWEWGRLNGIYRASDWTAPHFRRLEQQLSKGRWPEALQGESRIRDFLSTRPAPESVARTDNRFTIRREISWMLGTNLFGQELCCGRNSIHRYAEPNLASREWQANQTPQQPTITWLQQLFWAANQLGHVANGFTFTPFPDPIVRSKRLAKPNARTPTLSIDQAIGLLVSAIKCVNQHSELICELVHELGQIVWESHQTKANKKAILRLIERRWNLSAVRARAVDVLGCEITISSRACKGYMTVPLLVNILMSSCVVLIAGLNARRKDEIIHKTLGLRRDSINPINHELAVYEGMFYIEKTFKSYVPYYVNQATFDAYTALKKLEKAQFAVEKLFTGQERSVESMNHSMFWSRRVITSRQILNPRVWFSFSFESRGAARYFTNAALGKGLQLAGGGAHIFRRFYAIIFYYRFEHGGLLALRYQLAHLNCEMPKQYVTSAMIEAVEARIPIAMRRSPETVRAVIENEWQAVDAVIQEVGSEKLLSVITDLLDGQTFSGGFPRLVERLHRKLLSQLDYSAMDTERQARRLQQRLMGRGHTLRPLPHADCAAGTSKARGAKCSNGKDYGPAPENASADICYACPYSWTSKGHVEGLKLDLKVLDEDVANASQGTLLHESRLADRVNLQHAIWLHENRINSAH